MFFYILLRAITFNQTGLHPCGARCGNSFTDFVFLPPPPFPHPQNTGPIRSLPGRAVLVAALLKRPKPGDRRRGFLGRARRRLRPGGAAGGGGREALRGRREGRGHARLRVVDGLLPGHLLPLLTPLDLARVEAHAGARLLELLGLGVGVAPGPALHLRVELGGHHLPAAGIRDLLVHPLAGLEDELGRLLAALALARLLLLVARVLLAQHHLAGEGELLELLRLLRLAARARRRRLALELLRLLRFAELHELGGEVEAELGAHQRVLRAVAGAGRGGVGRRAHAGGAHLLGGVELPPLLGVLALPNGRGRGHVDRVGEGAAAADADAAAEELVAGVPGGPRKGGGERAALRVKCALVTRNVVGRHFSRACVAFGRTLSCVFGRGIDLHGGMALQFFLAAGVGIISS